MLIRVCGVLLGIGFIAIGAFSLFSAGPELEASIRERAQGFGLVATLGGVLAIVLSVCAKDLSGIWCAPPARGDMLRGQSARDDD